MWGWGAGGIGVQVHVSGTGQRMKTWEADVGIRANFWGVFGQFGFFPRGILWYQGSFLEHWRAFCGGGLGQCFEVFQGVLGHHFGTF